MTINKERLLKLATFLDGLPDDAFHFGTWIHGGADLPERYVLQDVTNALNCGTTACALGWCTAIPDFRALGVVFDKWGDVVLMKDGDVKGDWMDAARELFGINENEAKRLFLPSYGMDDEKLPEDATAKDVAEHIRNFVAEHE